MEGEGGEAEGTWWDRYRCTAPNDMWRCKCEHGFGLSPKRILTGVETDLSVVETSNCEVCSATGDPCECEQTFTMGTGRVIVHNVPGTCVLCGEGDPGGPGEEDDGPEEGDKCGVDIKKPLEQTLRWVDKAARWQLVHDKKQFQRDCQWLLTRSGWDVTVLVGTYVDRQPYNPYFHDLKGCGNLPHCAGTVEVDGKCYYAHQVNYVLFGFLGSWCGYRRTLLAELIRTWKGVTGRPEEADDAIAWMDTGFHRWPVESKASVPPEQVGRCHSCTESHDVNRYCWIWGRSTFRHNCYMGQE